jgi:xanthine dehydrogenase accessory factor
MEQPLLILVRGSGDVASAVAHLLFKAGYAVCMHDSAQPTATRRKMAFTDAIFDGSAVLDGVLARRADSLGDLGSLLAAGDLVPMSTLSLALLLENLRPTVLIDARMKKHAQPEEQMRLARLSIGLGPNFIAGETVHLAVETARGANLGRVITHGATQALEGEPNSIEGHARDRYVYAPQQGIFHTELQIGERVSQGQKIAQIETTRLLAPITGVLRGLTRDGVPVTLKTKVIEIDPRMEHAQISGIADRPARIAQGVLEGISDWEQKQAGEI